MKRIFIRILILSFCALTLYSINLFCTIKVSNTLIYYLSCICIITLSVFYCIKNNLYTKWIYIAPTCYIIWTIIEIIRGVFITDSYWVLNQLIHGTFNTLPPVIIFLFSSPLIFIKVFRTLNWFIVFTVIILAGWCLPFNAFAFILVPFFFLYSNFISKIPHTWFWITLIAVILIGMQIENRSGVIKVMCSLSVFCLFALPSRIQLFSLHVSHLLFYILAIVLLWLGLSGRYNIFDSSYFADPNQTYVFSTEDKGQKKQQSDLSIDTRTFIYLETITSALDLDYLWFGRTPAHGYITEYFAAEGPVEEGRDPSERFFCEVALLNTFNWLGIVGVILLSFVYLQGTFLALFFSNNTFVKCLAVWVAFQWLYSWIENGNQFQLMDLMIYSNLAMCYSSSFRRMSEKDFLLFFRSLFSRPNSISVFEKKEFIITYIKTRLIRIKS